jgi:GT2 family glycosyltransferase
MISKKHYKLSLAIQKAIKIVRHEGLLGFAKRLMSRLRQPLAWRTDYATWIRKYGTIDDEQCRQIRDHILAFSDQPLLSVVMPVHQPSLTFLKAAITSIHTQLYPRWELCIASSNTIDAEFKEILSYYATKDSRIKTIYVEVDASILQLSNFALHDVTGEFIVFFTPKDQLSEQALYHIAKAINCNPDAHIIYSDEDQIDEKGNCLEPHFKCEFNYELFLAQNIPFTLGVYKRSLLSDIEGLRIGYEEAAHYDLSLRALEHVKASQIIHLPYVLYHQRVLSDREKLLSAKVARKAVRKHLQRRKIQAGVQPAPECQCYNRIRFPLPDRLPLVSILIPTKDQANLLNKCITSIIERSSYPNFEITIIDNGSIESKTQELFSKLASQKIRIIKDVAPFNFSTLNNYGARVTDGPILCLMNNDIEVLSSDWLEEMVSFAIRSDIGCVGARLWYPSGFLQHGGVITGMGDVAGHAHLNLKKGELGYFGRAALHQQLSAVTAACLVVKRAIFEQVGGLDEQLSVAYNDIDFCLRVQQSGYRNIWTPYAEMIHYESATRGYETSPEKQARLQKETNLMQQRWGDILLNDPAYSPNLSLRQPSFTYAFPPRT